MNETMAAGWCPPAWRPPSPLPTSTTTSPLPPPPVLHDYLVTQRMAIPRFYFVAPADLLDILSKGSNPQAIVRWVAGGVVIACVDAYEGRDA